MSAGVWINSIVIYARKKHNQFRKWGRNRKWSQSFLTVRVFQYSWEIVDWTGVLTVPDDLRFDWFLGSSLKWQRAAIWEKGIWMIAAMLRTWAYFSESFKVSLSLCWLRDMVASQSRAGAAVQSLYAPTTRSFHFSSSAVLTWSPLRANIAPEYSAANTPLFLFKCWKLLGYLWLIMVVSF